jgi:signal transduction histidine kinase
VNLIVNAAQSMEESPDSSRVVVIQSSADDEDTVTVAVRDDGVGLDEEQKELIFDAFFTTRPGGMGMGLSINRTIVESLGGRLWATQNAGRGATFHFSLPTKQQGNAETNTRITDGPLNE